MSNRHSRDKSARTKLLSKPIACSKCGLPGGTMVKDGNDGYCHTGKDERCKLIQTGKLLTNVAAK